MITEPRVFTLRESPPVGERIDLWDPYGFNIVWTGKRWYDPQDSDGSPQTHEAWPPDGDGPWADRPPRIDIRKVAIYQPVATGLCGGCGKPILYNLAIQHVEHEESNPDCPWPWVRVERTPEEEARIAAAEAEAAAEDKAHRDRHAWLLEHAPHPVLQALIEAHCPASADQFPDCAACSAPPSEINGNPEPTSWPCDVWLFISNRLETP